MSAEFRDVELQIPQELNGLRLDIALARMLPEHSRTRIKGWIEAGQVQVGRLACKPRDVVSAGARVRVRMIGGAGIPRGIAGGDSAQGRARGPRRAGHRQAGRAGGASGSRQPAAHPAKRFVGMGSAPGRAPARRHHPSARQGHERAFDGRPHARGAHRADPRAHGAVGVPRVSRGLRRGHDFGRHHRSADRAPPQRPAAHGGAQRRAAGHHALSGARAIPRP